MPLLTSKFRRCKRAIGIAVTSAVLMGTLPATTAVAASSWNPTLIVNTESFQVIDVGDGTTNIEIKFGNLLDARIFFDITNLRFTFTKPVFIQGSLTATGSITTKGTLSGQNLIVSGVSSFSGAAMFKANTTIKGVLSGASLHVSGNSDFRGPLAVTGSIRTDGNLTINDDADTNDATLTFGNTSGNQTLKFSNTSQRFEFTKSLRVLGTITGSALRIDGNATFGGPLTATGSIRTKGNLSGSTLTVDGDITLHGVTYSAPSSQGGSNTFLKNDGAGNLTWGSTSVGNGSGGIMSLHPEYPNAIVFASGASMIGQLSASGGVTLNENFYHWITSRATLQDYWIAVRVRVPDNFASWDPVKPIELRYRTADGTSTNNHVTVRMKDTTNTYVPLTNAGNLASATFATAQITGPQAAGTWTPKGYITIYVKLASLTGKYAEAGFLNLNYETTTP